MWAEHALPILESIAKLEKSHEASASEISRATGLDFDDVALEMTRLEEAGYIRAIPAHSMEGDDWLDARLLEKGLRQVGIWPPTVADAFIASLEALIAQTTDEEQRSAIEKVRDAATGVLKVGGQAALSGAVAAATQGML